MPGQHLHIAARCRSGGRCTGRDVQAIEQVLAEPLSLSQVHRVVPRHADDAHIGPPHRALADPRQCSSLEEAQQLALEAEVEFADLVEKQRPAISQLRRALAIFPRAGRGAAGDAEEFGFHLLTRNGPAAEGDEAVLRSVG